MPSGVRIAIPCHGDEMTTSHPIFIFAGGGTGGHIYPGLAVADELLRIRPEAKVVFACSDRPIDRHILEQTPHAFAVQPVRPLPHGLGQAIDFTRRYIASASRPGR